MNEFQFIFILCDQNAWKKLFERKRWRIFSGGVIQLVGAKPSYRIEYPGQLKSCYFSFLGTSCVGIRCEQTVMAILRIFGPIPQLNCFSQQFHPMINLYSVQCSQFGVRQKTAFIPKSIAMWMQNARCEYAGFQLSFFNCATDDSDRDSGLWIYQTLELRI